MASHIPADSGSLSASGGETDGTHGPIHAATIQLTLNRNMKELNFMSVTDDTGRKSSLLLRDENIRVVGVLPHCCEIVPTSQEDADKLIYWLQNWKHTAAKNNTK